MAEGAQPPSAASTGPTALQLDNNNSSQCHSHSSHINNSSKFCGMLGINMPCEAAGHDFSNVVRKELEYANSIASHYTASLAAEKSTLSDHQHHQRSSGVGSFKIEVCRSLVEREDRPAEMQRAVLRGEQNSWL